VTFMRERIERGEAPLWGAFLGAGSPFMAEMLSRSGFDWLVIDMQHSPLNSSSELLGMVQAISLGQSAPFLRAPWKTQFGAIMAALDAGVEGVIIPMLETADEAEKISRCFRYPPRGDRSWGPWRVAMTDPDYSPEDGDRRALCLVQIETRQAMDNLDAILAVKDVDGAYIGPQDLSLSHGGGLSWRVTNPVLHDLCQKVLDACRRHGKIPVAHTADPDDAVQWASEGFQLVNVTSDTHLAQQGAVEALKILNKGAERTTRPSTTSTGG
jgi:4-hydroxy-2-oxoheptanedioate aldolase